MKALRKNQSVLVFICGKAEPDTLSLRMRERERETEVSSESSAIASDQSFQSTCNKCRNLKIVISLFLPIILILIVCLLYYKGRSVPSNHQKDAIKYPPVTCPPDWIGHQGHCYKLSREEKNWKESQNFCILHNASLAKITDEEMDFVTMLTRNHVFWIGLKREPDHSWKWLDGANA
ncbi:Early activation antigen CD69, partial [Ophiophagus hannah]